MQSQEDRRDGQGAPVATPLLRGRGVTKRFAGVTALERASTSTSAPARCTR